MASERIQRRIDSLLDEADQAIANEDWPIVASRVRSVLAIDPANSDAIAYQAAVERALGGSTPPTNIDPTTPTPTPTPTPAKTPDQPTSFAKGRYEVKRFLGEGGKTQA